MSDLISGKEALRALADGKPVEVKRIHDNEWQPAQIFGVSVFTDSETTSFRIKPHTITINGIEVVKPQKNMPKKGDDVYTLDFTRYEGYVSWTCQSSINTFSRDWWKSEDEIQQVVEALRQVFGIRHILTEDKFI